MNSPEFILDTDILSLLMRKNAAVLARAGAYLSEHQQFTISIITRYEILRGLKAKGALKQAERFEHFSARNRVLPINDRVIVQAADIYADLYQRGLLIADADNDELRPEYYLSKLKCRVRRKSFCYCPSRSQLST